MAAFAGSAPPEVHGMHRHRVPEFAGLGAQADLSGVLASASFNSADWAPAARHDALHHVLNSELWAVWQSKPTAATACGPFRRGACGAAGAPLGPGRPAHAIDNEIDRLALVARHGGATGGEIWFHDIFWPDGRPHDPAETRLISRLTATPAPQPGEKPVDWCESPAGQATGRVRRKR